MRNYADMVKKHGWLCQSVTPMPWERDEPPFSYSIGFYETYKQPEIMVIGYEEDISYKFLKGCLEIIQSGETLETEKRFNSILANGYQVGFKEIRKDLYEEHLGMAVRYYGHTDFPALVIFWPDKNNRLPWDTGYDGLNQEQMWRLV